MPIWPDASSLTRCTVGLFVLASACAPASSGSGAAPALAGAIPAASVSSSKDARTPSAPIAAASDAKPPAARPEMASPRFPPPNVTPPSARSADADDGRWQPLTSNSPSKPAESLLYTTVIHPHVSSRFITITLVAIDLDRLRLELMLGVDDVGKQNVPFVPGLVPATARAGVVAVFNGGFMPQHGRWGMQVGQVTLLPPREQGCSVAFFDQGVEIRSWPALASRSAELRALRQTPPCLVEDGAINADLQAGRDRAWAGNTPGIVTRRRSAIGLSADGRTLFYALGVEASPKLLATGLLAAGATFAAQLDINWNWTRFLVFGKDAAGNPKVSASLAEVQHTSRDYVEAPSKRDFFYLVERTAPAQR